MNNGRDFADRLLCQVPGCRAKIRAPTGFQEIVKLMDHMKRTHLVIYSLEQTLELRAKWEEASSP